MTGGALSAPVEDAVVDITLAFLFLFLVLIVLVLVSPAFLSRLRHADEKNLQPIYEAWCAVHRDSGARGSVGRNMFLWRVSFYPKFMVLALFSQDLIDYQELAAVELKDFQNSKEVWLRRQLEQGTELITIKTGHAERIVEALANVGVRATMAPARPPVEI
jgi:hypothetical protein